MVPKWLFHYQNCDPTNSDWAKQVCPQGKFCSSLTNLTASLPSPRFFLGARSAPCVPGAPMPVCVCVSLLPLLLTGHPRVPRQLLPIKTARGKGATLSAQPLCPALCWAPAPALLSQGEGGVELFCFGLNHRAGNSFQAGTFHFHWKGKTDS